MPPFQRVPGKFDYFGMDVHHPPDSLPANRASLIFNLQPDLLNNALTTRPPISALATTAAGVPVHSLVRLNDSVPGSAVPFARFAGAGASLYAGPASPLPSIDSGFSGNPLSFVPYRPAQAAEPWLYVYDSLKQQRYKTDGTKQNIGIAAPTVPASVARNQPLYTILEDAITTSSWFTGGASGGAVAGPALVSRIPAGTTIQTIVYDSVATGMACIAPGSAAGVFPWMTAGSRVKIDAEFVTIEQIFPGGYNTTVLAIQYDVGSTGLCTIVPTVPLPGLQRNMLIQLNSNAISVRVLSVTAGPDGSYSFRCDTGAVTIAATQTITAVPSFRAWTTTTHAFGAPLTANSLNFTFTPTVAGGTMQDLFGTAVGVNAPINVSFAGPRPLQNEDYMHLSLAFDHPEWVTELHVILNLAGGGLEDYLYYVLRPGDFQASIIGLGGVTTQQATLQSQLDALSSEISSSGVSATGVGENIPQPPYPAPEDISTSPPTTAQMLLGANAWTEVMFKLNDLTRVGSNSSLNLSNVTSLGMYIFVDGGPVNIYFGGWWAGGGYGPDCNFNSYGNQGTEIQWRYNYRNSLTGAHSTVSPETRNGEIVRRQGMLLTAPNSPDPQVDMIEWERRGGTNPDWHFVLQVPQDPSGTTTALDGITENAAQAGDPLEVTSYQPWPVTDTPKSGTALVVGTQVVWQSGDQFNLRWLRGTEVIIGGNTYSLYAPPISATVLQLAQSVVPPPGLYPFSIPEATIEGAFLYAGWLDEANNRVLACGDPLNPGFLYFSNNDNPDGASDAGYIEVTSPSEPLLNGFYMEGANYVFTSSSLYRVESTPGAVNPYVSYRLSGVEGLAGPWAFDAQRKIVFYFGPDGIYGYAFGPSADNLTAQDLFPLFPHEGQSGRGTIPGLPISIGGQTIFPPNYALSAQLRIGYSESFVYASYQNSNNATENLKYSLAAKGWVKETYKPQAALFALEKGIPNPLLMVAGVDGNVYQVASSGIFDPGGIIDGVLLTPAKDAGDSRAVKQFGDMMADYSGSFNYQFLWDNLLVSGASGTAPVQAQRGHQLLDLFTPPDTDDAPLIHYNIAMLLTTNTSPFYGYEWQPSYLPLPEITTSRVTDWQSPSGLHYKFVQGIRIHANTFGRNKAVQVQYDGYQLGPVIIFNSNGEQAIPFSFANSNLSPPPAFWFPFKCHMMRLVPLDDTPWDLFPDSEWIYEIEPEPACYWIPQPTALGQQGFLHCRELWFAYATPVDGAVVTLIVDGATPVTIATLLASASPKKQYIITPPLKGKLWQMSASGSGLQIYEKDLEFLVKSWGSTGPYARVKPFGDTAGGGGVTGARI